MTRKAEGETPESGQFSAEECGDPRGTRSSVRQTDVRPSRGRNLLEKTLVPRLWLPARDERKALLRGDDGGMSTGYAAITSQSEEERDVTHRFLRDRTVEL